MSPQLLFDYVVAGGLALIAVAAAGFFVAAMFGFFDKE